MNIFEKVIVYSKIQSRHYFYNHCPGINNTKFNEI